MLGSFHTPLLTYALEIKVQHLDLPKKLEIEEVKCISVGIKTLNVYVHYLLQVY